MNRILIRALSVLIVLACLLGCFAMTGCSGDLDADSDYAMTEEETNYVKLVVKGHGSIVVELRPDVAPKTVANFKKLVGEGFYNGLTFHRVIKGFMIQGGDPNGDGTGGSSENITGEFAANSIVNNLSHTRGVISMARRSDDNNSASSQFFICDSSTYISSLDGYYAAFGYVIEGMETVDSIATVKVSASTNKPLQDVVIEKAYFVNPKEGVTPPPASEVVIPDGSDPSDTSKPSESTVDMNEVIAEIDSMSVLDFHETDEVSEYVKISVRDHGDIIIKLRADVAPITVANFQKLVGESFYDELTFHRIIQNFMIQGGDPEGTGSGGSEEKIKGEFAANGVRNDLKHVRGVISMARRSYPLDSASSQFFICDTASTHLDGQYAAFGYVVAGLSVVDSIAAVEVSAGNNMPLSPVVIESIRFVTPEEEEEVTTEESAATDEVTEESATTDEVTEESATTDEVTEESVNTDETPVA
jgi:cyclophilin family peptidyl-prolyl cis-trans isomerase